MLDALADDVELPFESLLAGLARLKPGPAYVPRLGALADEEVLEDWLDGAGAVPERRVVRWHAPPAEQRLAFFVDDACDERLEGLALRRIVRQEDQAGAVLAGGRQVESEIERAKEPVRHLQQQAGAVTGVGLAAARAAVLEIDEELQALLDDVVRLLPLQVDDEADAARVLLVLRVVESLGLRAVCLVLHREHPSNGVRRRVELRRRVNWMP